MEYTLKLTHEMRIHIMQAETLTLDIPVENNWISVEGDLPKNKGRYMVIVNGGLIIITRYNKGMWQDYPGYITHWHPLPELPEMVEG